MNKIKTIVTFVVVAIIMVAMVGSIGWVDRHHTMKGTVVTQYLDGEVEVEDAIGNVWTFKGNGYTRGQEVVLVFNNNGTEYELEDDLLIDVR